MKTFTTALLLLLLSTSACVAAAPRTLSLPEGCTAWAALPMTVDVDPSAAGYRSQVNAAMKSWDRALARPAFVWNHVEETPADVLVAAGHVPGRARGVAPSFCYEGRQNALVMLDPGLDDLEATAFAAHELGHTLGLGHSPVHASIMFPTIDASLMGDWDEQTAQTILPTDARLALALHVTGPFALAPDDAGPAGARAEDAGIDAGPDNGIVTSPSVAGLPDLDKDPGGFAAHLLAAARGGQWRVLAALMLVAVVWLARRFGARAVPWLATDRGGVLLVLLLALVGGVATALADSAAISFGLLVNSVSMALTAAGGWAMVKKLLAPGDA